MLETNLTLVFINNTATSILWDGMKTDF